MCQSSFSPLKRRLLMASTALLLFIPPVLSTLLFFWPLIVSTLLGVLAVVSFNGKEGGFWAGPEEERTKNCIAGSDRAISPPVHVDRITDVLMVGNEEVTWLEWLHNEDMEKCRAQERLHAMQEATRELNERDLGVEEKSRLYAYGSSVAEEGSVNEHVENAGDVNMSALLSPPPSSVSMADAMGPICDNVSVVRENAAAVLGVEDMANELALRHEAKNVKQDEGNLLMAEGMPAMNAITMEKGICCDSRAACGGTCQNAVNGSECACMKGGEIQTLALMMQGGSVMSAFGPDVNATSQCSSTMVVESKCDYVSVDGDKGDCELPPPSSNTMIARDTPKTSSPKGGMPKGGTSLMSEAEASVINEMEHAHKENEMEHSHKENEMEHSHKEDVDASAVHKMGHVHQKRDTRENDGGPIWDVSDEDENKSSLQFSFFHGGCLALIPTKVEAEDVATHV